MTKIVLLGANGQVGSQLRQTLAPIGSVLQLERSQVDLTNSDRLRGLLRRESPQVIVNAAAYTAVDCAESEPELAYAINSSAVQVMAEEARRTGALLVHYSTDYVFDGTKAGGYIEEDAPNPLSVYGSTKLAGERAIQASECRHLIFRTSWVYGATGGNFPKAILKAANERDRLTVVNDQVGAPTSAELIAEVTARCAEQVIRSSQQSHCGLYHMTASGHTSWHGYAKFLVETAAQAGLRPRVTAENVQPVSSAQYGAVARRPASSVLSTRKLQQAFGIELPHWTVHARRFVERAASSIE